MSGWSGLFRFSEVTHEFTDVVAVVGLLLADGWRTHSVQAIGWDPQVLERDRPRDMPSRADIERLRKCSCRNAC
jgi:hypothetical protein